MRVLEGENGYEEEAETWGELSGKVAIVTGGSHGTGAANAAALAEAGAAVTVLARDGAAAAQVADAIVARGGDAFGISREHVENADTGKR